MHEWYIFTMFLKEKKLSKIKLTLCNCIHKLKLNIKIVWIKIVMKRNVGKLERYGEKNKEKDLRLERRERRGTYDTFSSLLRLLWGPHWERSRKEGTFFCTVFSFSPHLSQLFLSFHFQYNCKWNHTTYIK